MKHLYIHIPFCRRRCAYCDFNTYANLDNRIEAYVSSLCIELQMLASEYAYIDTDYSCMSYAHWNNGSSMPLGSDTLPPTLFLGGGTPSLLTLDQLERVLRAASQVIPLEHAEITLEANPGTLMGTDTHALAYLQGLRVLGVNRLSLGVQSLHDPTLRVLGRTHTAAEARRCYLTAREAGFDSINLDFMFGLPGQSLAQWQESLDEIITWDVDHFSLYSLILEERTPLYAQVLRGQVTLPDDDDSAAMYEVAMSRFAAAGYVQYEISNWAKSKNPGATGESQAESRSYHPTFFACIHNLAYWLNSNYLAAGAGAHGHVYPRRYHNLLGVDEYIQTVRAGDRPLAEVVDLTPYDLYAETMFMGLRLNVGVSRAHFRARCAIDMEAVFGQTLIELAELDLIEYDTDAVRLTARGRMLGNQVFERFV